MYLLSILITTLDTIHKYEYIFNMPNNPYIRSIDESDIETVLQEDANFDGKADFLAPVLIKGNFKGTITSNDHVFIGNNAHIRAKINAKTMSIRGYIKGDIELTDQLELFTSSTIKGSAKASEVITQVGAKIDAHILSHGAVPPHTPSPTPQKKGSPSSSSSK